MAAAVVLKKPAEIIDLETLECWPNLTDKISSRVEIIGFARINIKFLPSHLLSADLLSESGETNRFSPLFRNY